MLRYCPCVLTLTQIVCNGPSRQKAAEHWNKYSPFTGRADTDERHSALAISPPTKNAVGRSGVDESLALRQGSGILYSITRRHWDLCRTVAAIDSDCHLPDWVGRLILTAARLVFATEASDAMLTLLQSPTPAVPHTGHGGSASSTAAAASTPQPETPSEGDDGLE